MSELQPLRWADFEAKIQRFERGHWGWNVYHDGRLIVGGTGSNKAQAEASAARCIDQRIKASLPSEQLGGEELERRVRDRRGGFLEEVAP